MPTVDEILQQGQARALAGLASFLRWPSVSADPEQANAVQGCAAWLADELRNAGLEHVQLWDTGEAAGMATRGNPVVYADWLHAAGAPTVLLYGHYDVQPPEPLALWESPPFEPTERDGKLYARGASDDKGQVYLHLVALRALLLAQGSLPVNIRLLIEGEEEVGSPNLAAAIRAHRGELAADLALISDSSMYAEGQPALVYGLRGMAYFQLDLEGANSDLHSGQYGGAVANPLQALCTLLAGLKDEQGRIALPGFYDDVRPSDSEERARLAALPFDEAAYRAPLGLEALAGEEGFGTLERTWTRPSLDLNGIWGGYAGPGAKTVLPARAGAKLSFRLVPDQQPERVAHLLEEDLRRRLPAGVRLHLRSLHGARPWISSPEHPYLQAASRALARAFGREAVYIREGGSIPVVSTFDEELQLPTVLLGLGLPDDRAHAPNEHLSLRGFHDGARAAAYFYEELAGRRT